MSETHTQGRIVARDDKVMMRTQWLIPEAHADRPIGGSSDKIKDREHYANVVMTVNGKYHDNRANARRMAACWNAWVGVSTEEIEALCGVALFKGKPVGTLAEALELLGEVRDSYDVDGDTVRTALLDRIRTFLKGQP